MKNNLKNIYYYVFTAFLFFPIVAAGAAPASVGGGCNATTGIRQSNFKCVVGFVSDAINQLVLVLLGIGLLVFIWGLVKYVAAAGDEAQIKEAKQFIVFGLIAFFIMFSVWGLVNILVGFFFPNGSGLLIPQIR
jgi:hypothetical protein